MTWIDFARETVLPPAIIIFTIGAWSFLYKENRLYRFVEYTLVAAGVGTMVVVSLDSVVKIGWGNISSGQIEYIIPLILGALLYTRFWPNYAWIQRYPTALITAVFTGLTVRGIIGMEVMRQLEATISGSLFNINDLIILLSVVFGIYYFMFTKKFTLPPQYNTPLKKIGRLVIMVLFGFYLGNTVMSRLSYAIDRLQYIFAYLGL